MFEGRLLVRSMSKICNTADSSFVMGRCHTGVNMMYGGMNSHWQNVRKECGQWPFTQNGTSYTGVYPSPACTTANSNLIANAFYIQNVRRVPVTSGLTESTDVGLWSKVTA